MIFPDGAITALERLRRTTGSWGAEMASAQPRSGPRLLVRHADQVAD